MHYYINWALCYFPTFILPGRSLHAVYEKLRETKADLRKKSPQRFSFFRTPCRSMGKVLLLLQVQFNVAIFPTGLRWLKEATLSVSTMPVKL